VQFFILEILFLQLQKSFIKILSYYDFSSRFRTSPFGNYLFRDVNFTIKKDDKVGLVGKNGAGKSTILKMLSGEITFFEGNIVPEGNITIGFLKQDLDFVKGRTVWNETLQAFEQINAWKNELEEVNHQLATRTDYESDAYHDLIHRMTDLNDILHHHDAYNLEGDVEKVLLGLGFKAADLIGLQMNFLEDGE
jgi:ATP-binding cassette subfamily F protein 3